MTLASLTFVPSSFPDREGWQPPTDPVPNESRSASHHNILDEVNSSLSVGQNGVPFHGMTDDIETSSSLVRQGANMHKADVSNDVAGGASESQNLDLNCFRSDVSGD